MTIFLAADHAGFPLKQLLVPFVRDELGFSVEDCGAHTLDPHDDYPEIMQHAAQAVANDPEWRQAILLGGSGQGEAMVANRYKDVRAAVYYGGSKDILTLSRTHNNANVLSLGARFLKEHEAREAVALFLSTPFLYEARHKRRIQAIDV